MPAGCRKVSQAGPACPLMSPLPSAAGYRGLDLENNTIGILVSTAVELSIGGKTLKPAGEQGPGPGAAGLGTALSPSRAGADPVPPAACGSPLLFPSGGGEAGPGGLGGEVQGAGKQPDGP